MKDYYRILQIVPEAGEAEVKKAYRRLATQYHPDKNPAPDSNAVFQEINEAYQVVGDARQRQIYDLLRQYPEELAAYTAPPRRPPSAYGRRAVYFDLRPYVRYSRIICLLSLAFCGLLVLDYALPRETREEPIIEMRVYKRENRVVVYTPHHHYSVEGSGGFAMSLNEYTPVELEYTRILSVVTKVRLRNLVSHPASIYGPLAFFPALLLILSALGVWGRGGDEMTVNFGISTTIILLITAFLMFLVF